MIRCCSNIVLSGAQAGLNWSLVPKKREGYRRAFDKFDPETVARYSEKQILTLLSDPEIIRNRMKIEAAVRNACAFLKVQEEFGDFDSYCWHFVGGQPKLNRWKATRQIPATSPESQTFSKDLKHRGFSFVGPTVAYAYMQAVGMVNDHLVDCFRYRILREVANAQTALPRHFYSAAGRSTKRLNLIRRSGGIYMSDTIIIATFADTNSAYAAANALRELKDEKVVDLKLKPGIIVTKDDLGNISLLDSKTRPFFGTALAPASDFAESVKSEMRPGTAVIIFEVDEKSPRPIDDIVEKYGGHVRRQAA